MNAILLLAAALTLPGVPTLALAQAQAPQAEKTEKADAAMTDGEVRRVDTAAQKITLRHGPIKNVDMPAMTMVFQVRDPAMLNSVKAGDKVRFTVDKINGAYTVTHIEPAR